MTWRGCKIFAGRGNGIDVGLPSQQDKNGKKGENGSVLWYDTIIVETTEEGNTPGDKFMEHVREAVQKEYTKLTGAPAQPTDQTSPDNPDEAFQDNIPF